VDRSSAARICIVCALGTITAPSLSGCGLEAGSNAEGAVDSVAQPVATDLAVYTNTSPASPWQSWSWSTTVLLANADAPLASGSTSHIKATALSVGAGLSLAYSTTDLSVAAYDAITFDVRGPAASSLHFSLESLAGVGDGPQPLVPVTTKWTRQTIKLAAVAGSLTRFGKLDWLSSQKGQIFYVDNVKLIAKAAAPAPAPVPTPAPVPAPAPASSTFPTAPLTVTKNDVVTLNSSASPYYVYVPSSYDATHATPAKLLVWLHGCGGQAYGDAWVVSPGGTQSWVTVSVGGRDGGCWSPGTDATLVLAALDDVKRRLNVDPRRVVIGGYSSGGDMAYRTAFYNARRFAGVVAENTSPFRDTGSTAAASIAAAAWKLNVAHLAHLSDTVYPIATVRAETDALKLAGFPETRLERPGTHWDADTASTGTGYDLRRYLLPYLDAGWLAP
jgi:predicted esterase